MKRKKRSQISMEFVGLISFMFLVFVIFFVIINEKMVEYQQQKNWQSLMELGEMIEKEMDLALKAEDGYMRQFSLPPNIKGKFYNITVESSSTRVGKNLVMGFSNFSYSQKNVIMIPANVDIEIISPGENVIFKSAGKVSVNKVPSGSSTYAPYRELYIPPSTTPPTITPPAQQQIPEEPPVAPPAGAQSIIKIASTVKISNLVKIISNT